MLRNRSIALKSKQSQMSDQTPSFLSPTKNSPTFFLSKSVLDAETMSPTSVIDSPNSFSCDKPPPPPCSAAIGLALIDSIADDQSCDCRFSKLINRVELSGSKLKVQIPEIMSSPADFGIKTRSSQVDSPLGGGGGGKDLARQLSLKEMEMSEDYTCVIKHGPNPVTRHIYDDCILDDQKLDVSQPQIQQSLDFLTISHACKALLQQDKDIYVIQG